MTYLDALQGSCMFRPGRWYPLLTDLGRFLLFPLTRYAAAWLLALGVTAAAFATGWNYFNSLDAEGNPLRRDGNSGHTKIDFGGQWAMGRMLVLGEGEHLYDRDRQLAMLRDSYPVEDQEPRKPDEPSDADWMLCWFMEWQDPEPPKLLASCAAPLAGADAVQVLMLAAAAEPAWQPGPLEEASRAAHRKVGGPLYPPINAFLMYPLALLRPQDAYRLRQFLDLPLALLTVWGVALLSRGRLWLPVVLTLLVVYPGFYGSNLLGQNALLTLLILVWGWVLLGRGREGWAGLLWGLLAFKPVWALSFFLVLLLSRRWRGCAAMAVCGAAQIALTLPVVGVQAWRDWLHVGEAAAELYKVDGNWIGFSRDLLSVPRRWMLDFRVPWTMRDVPEAGTAGWALLLSVFALFVVVCVWKRKQVRAVEGPGAAFLLLGGWLCCYHFMYYDVLLTFLPLLLLFTGSGWRLRPHWLARVPLLWRTWLLRPWSTQPAPPGRSRFRVTSAEPAMLWLPALRGYGTLANSFPLLILVLLLALEGPLRTVGPAVTAALDQGLPGLELKDLVGETLTFADRGTPWNTFCLLLLWLWCGWQVVRQPAARTPDAPGQPVECNPEILQHASVNGRAVTPAPARVSELQASLQPDWIPNTA